MTPTEQIADFVRRALAQGSNPDQIDHALAEAGWSARERQTALSAWTMAAGMPPVPRPRPYVSAREALLYGLLFISLGMVAIHLCQMGFLLIDNLLPDQTRADHLIQRGMRWPMAALITFTPAFLILNRAVMRGTDADRGRRRSLVRKWCASVTLLIAALTLLGDLVAAVYTLLDGEMTLPFALKLLIVAGVAGLVIAYHRDELND